ncbi:MAG: sodium/proton-translocating pyrophosphatase, partial [Trebonia sp.]
MASANNPLAISGGQYGIVIVVGVFALLALGFAGVLVREVLAVDQGTPKLQEISRAVQEGAAAYLNRQFRTLAIFSVIVFILLLILPVNEGGWSVRIGRAIFFLVGASFSAMVGYIGMTMATRANVRVAAAARNGGKGGFHIAIRTGGIVGMLTVGLCLLGATIVLLIFNEHAPTVL